MPDQRAIERVRAGPSHSAVMRASVVGHAGGNAPEDPGHDEHRDRWGPGGQERGGNSGSHAQHEHPLAPVAVADRPEVEDRTGEPKAEPNAHQIELDLRSLELQADLGQRHVGDGQVEVGHSGDRDERKQHPRFLGRDARKDGGRPGTARRTRSASWPSWHRSMIADRPNMRVHGPPPGE